MSKCGFNKVGKELYWNHTSAWVFSCKFAAYFQNTFEELLLRGNSEIKGHIGRNFWVRDYRKKLLGTFETSHLICRVNHITGFRGECNTEIG